MCLNDNRKEMIVNFFSQNIYNLPVLVYLLVTQ